MNNAASPLTDCADCGAPTPVACIASGICDSCADIAAEHGAEQTAGA